MKKTSTIDLAFAAVSAWSIPLDVRTNAQIWADYSDADLHRIYNGAWNACDGSTAWKCKMEWSRRGVDAAQLPGWPREAR